MKLNGKRVAGGLAAAGLAAGALASGGVALASARTPAAPATWAAATAGPRTSWCWHDPGDPSGMIRGQWGHQPLIGAAAAYLGMSQAEVRTQLRAGQSLADLARAQHKQPAGLMAAILAPMTSRINASSTLTTGQKSAMLREMRSQLDDMVNAVPRSVTGPGRMSPAAGMGMWR